MAKGQAGDDIHGEVVDGVGQVDGGRVAAVVSACRLAPKMVQQLVYDGVDYGLHAQCFTTAVPVGRRPLASLAIT